MKRGQPVPKTRRNRTACFMSKLIYLGVDENDSSLLKRSGYPKRSRILPTRFGNAMRAGEDLASAECGEPIQQVVVQQFDTTPPAVQDQYRWTQLSSTCTGNLRLFGLFATSVVDNP